MSRVEETRYPAGSQAPALGTHLPAKLQLRNSRLYAYRAAMTKRSFGNKCIPKPELGNEREDGYPLLEIRTPREVSGNEQE